MRLQDLPKALCPLVLACSWASAQQNGQDSPAQPNEVVTQLPPPKPLQEFPAEQTVPPAETVAPAPGTPSPAEDAPIVPIEEGQDSPAPAPSQETLPATEPTPLDSSVVTDENVGPPPVVDGDNVGPAPGAVQELSGHEADALRDLDVATPDILNNERPWLSGFGFGGSASFLYDTNVYQSSGLGRLPKTADFVLGFKPYIAYGSEKYGLTYTGKLTLDGNEYFDNSRLSGVGYALDFALGYTGRRFTGMLNIDQALEANVDRNYGDYVERDVFKLYSKLNYKLSSKTSLESRFGFNSISPRDDRYYDTSKDFANIAMVWQTTPLISLAGGLGFSTAQGDRQVDRDTVGPILRAIYQYSTKVSVETDLGVDFVHYAGGGGDDSFLSAQVTAKYVPSPFWAFDLSFVRDTDPDGAIPGAYRAVTGVRAGVQKKLYKATIALGLGYEQDTYTRPDGGSVLGLDRDYYTADLSVTRPIYKDMVDLQVFTRYRNQEADTAVQTWNGMQYGIGVQASF